MKAYDRGVAIAAYLDGVLAKEEKDRISPNKNTPTPVSEYRQLNDGELVMDGDEFWGMDKCWLPATEIGKKVTTYTHKMYRRPMTETSSQTTDTCPDCSDIPCDCGPPAGYKTDIRFAANFAPHIKVIEATKVAEIIQQRDELLRYNEAFRQETLICANCDAISKEEYDQAIEQRDAAHDEIERLQCAGIHSCHDNCERPNCVLRREIKATTEQRDNFKKELEIANYRLKGERHPDDNGIMADGEIDVKSIIEQRDAASAEFYRYHGLWDRATKQLETVMYQRDRLAEAIRKHKFDDVKLWQALQSLNPDHTVATNDMIPAVKGENHES